VGDFGSPDASAPLAEPATPDLGECAMPMRVATWNLRTFPLSAQASTLAHQALTDLDLDLVGLEEIADADAFHDLRDALPEHHGFLGKPGFATGVAILYRSERLHVLDIEDLFESDHWAFPRAPLAVTFELQADVPQVFTVVVLHLKARSGADNEQRRKAAMDKLHGWAGARSEPVLLIGDYNDRVDDGAADDIFAEFRDPNFRILTASAAARGDFSYIRYHSLIDHGIASRDFEDQMPTISVTVPAIEEVVANYEKYLSDHRPVISEHCPTPAPRALPTPTEYLP
jgi:endonuclease/exonuclease/phosphatase (EEP) superfamily protein YafD